MYDHKVPQKAVFICIMFSHLQEIEVQNEVSFALVVWNGAVLPNKLRKGFWYVFQ